MDVTSLAVAAIIPATVWILWRLQTLSVAILRNRLLVLTKHADQRWIYWIVSWFGTFLHEASHASVLLLSGHGLRKFKAGVEQGHVVPARLHGGFGMLFFLVAALAPLFIPPLLVVLGFWFALDLQIITYPQSAVILADLRPTLEPWLLLLPQQLVGAVARLDLTNWKHVALLAVILISAPGSRPSHVKGSRYHGTEDEGDVAALRRRIREAPRPFLLFLAALYGSFFLFTAVAPAAYWYPIFTLWALAVTGVVVALIGAIFWTLAGLDGRVKIAGAWIGPASFVLMQYLGRAAPWDLSLMEINLTSLAAWLLFSLSVAAMLPRRK